MGAGMSDHSKRRMKYFFCLCAVAALALLLLVAFMGLWCMSAHGVPKSKLVQLHCGMDAANVRALLGKADGVYGDPDRSMSWTYDRMTWCYVTIRFSPSGDVVEIIHDH